MGSSLSNMHDHVIMIPYRLWAHLKRVSVFATNLFLRVLVSRCFAAARVPTRCVHDHRSNLYGPVNAGCKSQRYEFAGEIQFTPSKIKQRQCHGENDDVNSATVPKLPQENGTANAKHKQMRKCSLLAACCSLLASRCSLLAVRCSPLAARLSQKNKNATNSKQNP
jgi:hypothetical protein